jgi:diaminopimelate decarboxylase
VSSDLYSIKHVGLGGGLGVTYQDKDNAVDLELVKGELDKCFENVPYQLSFEPGRYLVANAGILITSVMTIKNNGGINFLVTDAGMHSLIRPALYQAHHDIEVVDKSNSELVTYSVAGPICESSDILDKNITLPKQKVGNLLIIKDTGAYGKVMASNYNSRGLPIEILVNNNIFQKIYQPLTSKEFINQDIIPEWLD